MTIQRLDPATMTRMPGLHQTVRAGNTVYMFTGTWPHVYIKVFVDDPQGVDPDAQANATVSLRGAVPKELPIDEVHAVGVDAAGNFYVMVRIWRSGWTGTESWYFFGVSPEGTVLGSVMVSLESYAGAGWTVTPAGKILEVFTTEAGVGVIEYTLK